MPRVETSTSNFLAPQQPQVGRGARPNPFAALISSLKLAIQPAELTLPAVQVAPAAAPDNKPEPASPDSKAPHSTAADTGDTAEPQAQAAAPPAQESAPQAQQSAELPTDGAAPAADPELHRDAPPFVSSQPLGVPGPNPVRDTAPAPEAHVRNSVPTAEPKPSPLPAQPVPTASTPESAPQPQALPATSAAPSANDPAAPATQSAPSPEVERQPLSSDRQPSVGEPRGTLDSEARTDPRPLSTRSPVPAHSASAAAQPQAQANISGVLQSGDQQAATPDKMAPSREPAPAAAHGPPTSQSLAPPSQPSASAAPIAAQTAQGTPAPTAIKPLNANSGNVAPLGAASAAAAKHAALNRLTAQAPLLKQSIEQHSFVPQAAKGLALALKQGDGTITLKLTPANLGTLKVEVTLEGSEVTAKLQASSESARQLLIDAQPSLRAALEARGLSVERIEVTAAPPGAPAQDARPDNPDHPGAELADDGRNRNAGHEADEGHSSHARKHGPPGSEQPEGPALGELPASTHVSLALDHGGVYRLHLDAVA